MRRRIATSGVPTFRRQNFSSTRNRRPSSRMSSARASSRCIGRTRGAPRARVREPMHWTSGGGAERLLIAWMTPNGFSFLGVQPLLGRVFGAADAAPGAPPVAVMNHRAWVRLFAADAGVIGRTLMLDGQPRTVIGVMPPRFEWNIADLWLPAEMSRADDPQSARGTRAFQAHLKPGVSVEEAEAQLNVVAARRAA